MDLLDRAHTDRLGILTCSGLLVKLKEKRIVTGQSCFRRATNKQKEKVLIFILIRKCYQPGYPQLRFSHLKEILVVLV